MIRTCARIRIESSGDRQSSITRKAVEMELIWLYAYIVLIDNVIPQTALALEGFLLTL